MKSEDSRINKTDESAFTNDEIDQFEIDLAKELDNYIKIYQEYNETLDKSLELLKKVKYFHV